MNNESDTIVYIEKSGVEMMDFRKKKTSNGYEEWEENIIIDENNNKATIEINGIDNGIMVDYKFEKINEKWILVEIYDGST